MKKHITCTLTMALLLSLVACHSDNSHKVYPVAAKPLVKNDGRFIEFPADSVTLGFFKMANVTQGNLDAEFTAPARVAATVVHSRENPEQNLVLFDNPDLTANYTSLLQHIVGIRQQQGIIRQKLAISRQKETEVARYSDLANHGAGTGKDVADAKTDLIAAQTEYSVAVTELANEKTAIIEHEALLKLAGFDPESLIHARPDKVWLISDVPENLVTKIKEGNTCTLRFTAFPDEAFTGSIEDVGEVIDNTTRMVKLRIGLANSGNRLRAGMFAQVQFGVIESNALSIPKAALVAVQGKNFVFVCNAAGVFERREVVAGIQLGDRTLILSGLKAQEKVVTEGAMQLKGLSFGY